MQFIQPALKILEKYYQTPETNLKLLLSNSKNSSEKFLQGSRGRFFQKESPGRRRQDGSEFQAVTRTVYGVVRKERLLEHIIRQVSARKLVKIQAGVLVLLKIGAYLMFFSKSYPDYAVVNEVVACAGGKTKGFVNGVLRNMVRRKRELMDSLDGIEALDVKYSVSPLLIENLERVSLGVEEDLEYLNREPLFHLRVHEGVLSYGEVRGVLVEQGVSFKELEAFRCFEIKEAGVVVRELVKGNGFYFQNTGSQVIAFIASRLAKKNVLDCCAAPGTKSVTTALLNSQLDIYANDIHWGRARMIGEFVERLGLDRVRTVVSDIKTLPFKGNFDFIMVDAPCSSSGTLRKNPDLKLKVDGKRVARNAKEQYEIMQSLMAGCSTGGARILYSVCSFIKEETEDVMELSLAGSSGGKHIEIIDLTPVMEEYGFRYKKGKYGVYLLPSDELNNDLFYLALMKV